MTTPEEIIGVDAVLALSMAGYQIVEAPQVLMDLGPTDFDEVWAVYPNKVAKQAAVKAYRAARKKGVSQRTILEGVKSYISTKPVDRPWMMLATFCNGERWNDAPATVFKNNLAGERAKLELEIANGYSRDQGNGHHAVGRLPFGG